MIVHFFTVTQNSNSYSVDVLASMFGSNIPKYMPFEGGSHIQYLFCVNNSLDEIISLCKEANFSLNELCPFKKATITNDMYNNKHYVSLNYSGNDYYVLMAVE